MKEEFVTVDGVSREYPGEFALDLGVDIEGLAVGLELDGFGMILPVKASWARCFRCIFLVLLAA